MRRVDAAGGPLACRRLTPQASVFTRRVIVESQSGADQIVNSIFGREHLFNLNEDGGGTDKKSLLTNEEP